MALVGVLVAAVRFVEVATHQMCYLLLTPHNINIFSGEYNIILKALATIPDSVISHAIVGAASPSGDSSSDLLLARCELDRVARSSSSCLTTTQPLSKSGMGDVRQAAGAPPPSVPKNVVLTLSRYFVAVDLDVLTFHLLVADELHVAGANGGYSRRLLVWLSPLLDSECGLHG